MLVSMPAHKMILPLLLVLLVNANDAKITTLALSGGGVKGAVYGGAIQALEESGVMNDIVRFSGTSAGSSVATMLAMGFDTREIREQIMGTNFADLVEYSISNVLWSVLFGGRGTSDLLAKISKRKGFFHGNNLEHTVDMSLAMKRCSVAYNISYEPVYASENGEEHPLMYGMCAKFRNTTFRDFKLFSPNRSLALSAFDITNGSLVYFSDRTTPNMKIATAVRISSSIPVIFEPVEYKGHLFVDGGVMRRLPIDAFPEIETDSNMLAFLLQSDYEKVTPETIEKMGLGSYVKHVLRTLIKLTQDLDIVERAKRKGLGVISFGKFPNISSVSAINFHLSETQKVGMYHSGYLAVREYLYSNRIVDTIDNGKESAWLDQMYAIAFEKDIHQADMNPSSLFRVFDPYIVLNLTLFLFVLASLSVIVIQIRNAFHALLLQKYSGIRTSRCASCHRNWIPGELTIRETSYMSLSDLRAACESRGIRASDNSVKNAKRLVRPLRKALYIENISFRRPWSILTACVTVDRHGLCRDIPCQYSALICVLALYVAYQHSKFQSSLSVLED